MCNFSVILFNNYKQTLFFSFFSLYSHLNYYVLFSFRFQSQISNWGDRGEWGTVAHTDAYASVFVWCKCMNFRLHVCVWVWRRRQSRRRCEVAMETSCGMTFCLLFVCLFARESDVSLRRSIAEEGRNVSFAVFVVVVCWTMPMGICFEHCCIWFVCCCCCCCVINSKEENS